MSFTSTSFFFSPQNQIIFFFFYIAIWVSDEIKTAPHPPALFIYLKKTFRRKIIERHTFKSNLLEFIRETEGFFRPRK